MADTIRRKVILVCHIIRGVPREAVKGLLDQRATSVEDMKTTYSKFHSQHG